MDCEFAKTCMHKSNKNQKHIVYVLTLYQLNYIVADGSTSKIKKKMLVNILLMLDIIW